MMSTQTKNQGKSTIFECEYSLVMKGSRVQVPFSASKKKSGVPRDFKGFRYFCVDRKPEK